MAENNPRLGAFEAKLLQLRKNMEAGLTERAVRIKGHLDQLSTATQEAREGLRHEAHKLRGVAGTFGHVALGELAGALEQVALDASSETVSRLTHQLVDAVENAVKAPKATGSTVRGESKTTVPAATSPHVLAVDDDLETRKLLELTLRQLGHFNATVARSGTEALELLSNQRFDLVLCDAMMPDMNGLEFCARALALNATHPKPPIVILSAATSEELGWNVAVTHAPAAWWRKPFRPKQLVEDVKALLTARVTD